MTHKRTPSDLALWAALPMAQTTRIEGRLKMILNPRCKRKALTHRALFVSLVAAALGCGVVSALKFEARARAASVPSLWKQTLANGMRVELLGVSNAPTRQNGGWWMPDGSPLAGSPFGPPMDNPVAGRDRRAFAVRVTPSISGPPWYLPDYVVIFEVSGATSTATALGMVSSYAPRMPGLDVVSAGAAKLPTQGILRCGVAAGAYEKVRSAGINLLPAGGGFTFHGSRGSVIFSRPSQRRGSAAITMSDTFSIKEGESEVVAIDILGKTVLGDTYSQVDSGEMHQTIIIFKGLPLSRIKEIRFVARPYQWAEFRGIAMKPGRGEAHR